jgi:tetratricopeptide (TPR) repeat protein
LKDRRLTKKLRKGIEYYNQALAIDPGDASAYEGVATAWNFLSDLYVSPREAMPKAKAAAINALQRNDTSARAHVSLGLVKMQYEWDWAGAEQEFKRAMALRAQPTVALTVSPDVCGTALPPIVPAYSDPRDGRDGWVAHAAACFSRNRCLN